MQIRENHRNKSSEPLLTRTVLRLPLSNFQLILRSNDVSDIQIFQAGIWHI